MTFTPLQTLDDVPSQLEAMDVPAMSLAYTTTRGIVVRTWGDVSEDTLFHAASIAKPVLAYAALELSSRGALDLDADVNDVLHAWKVPPVGDWQPVVTTRMLLAHVAGFADGGGQDAHDPRMLQLPNLLSSYSNDGYELVARVIADVCGTPIDEAMRELVLEPLEMSSTTFSTPPEDRRTRGHPDERSHGWTWEMWTTSSDLARFALSVNARTHPEMLAGHPLEPAMGLGVFLTSHDGIDWWSHGGSAPGFQSMLCGCAAAQFAAAAMTNGARGALCALDALRVVAAEHGPGQLVVRHVSTEGRAAYARMTEVAKQAAGRYVLGAGTQIDLGLTPQLWGQVELVLTLPGQPPIELARVMDGMWRLPGFESYLVYEPPDTVRLIQGGRDVRATRVQPPEADR